MENDGGCSKSFPIMHHTIIRVVECLSKPWCAVLVKVQLCLQTINNVLFAQTIYKKNITGVMMYPLRGQLFSSWRIIVISWRLQYVQCSENSYPVLIVHTHFQLEQSQTRCPALQGFKDVFKLNGVLYLANWMLYMK